MISEVTKKRKILFLIPFSIVAALLLYSWFTFLITDYSAMFNHYIGLVLFIPIVYFLLKQKAFKTAIVLLGIYLFLATINLGSFLPFVTSSSFGIRIGSFTIWTPKFNGLGLAVFLIYIILNFDTLVDIRLDYLEAKGKL